MTYYDLDIDPVTIPFYQYNILNEQSVELSKVKNDLKNYGKELGVLSDITLENLIDSHRKLRLLAIELNESKQNVLEQEREKAEKYFHETLKNTNYIKLEDLSKMTLGEIAEKIK